MRSLRSVVSRSRLRIRARNLCSRNHSFTQTNAASSSVTVINIVVCRMMQYQIASGTLRRYTLSPPMIIRNRPPDANAFWPVNRFFSKSNILLFLTGRAGVKFSRARAPAPHNKLAGEPARRVDSGRDFSWHFVHRGYASVPEALIPGRAAALHVFIWREVSLLFHHRRTCAATLQRLITHLLAIPTNCIHYWCQDFATHFVQHFS